VQAEVSPIYAGLWRRGAAVVIDGVVVFLLGGALGLVLGLIFSIRGTNSERHLLVIQLLAIVGGALYRILFHASSYQATLGKQAMGIKVADQLGARVSLRQSTGRYFAEWLSACTLGVGYVMAGFTRRRQALHDRLAKTVVVRDSVSAEVIAMAPEARRVGPIGTTLLVLLGILPTAGAVVLGVMSARYSAQLRQAQQGVTPAQAHPQISRTDLEAGQRQVRAALFAVQPYRAQVSQRIAAGVPFADLAGGDLRGTLPVEARNVESVDITDGVIRIVFGPDALEGLAGEQLALVPGRGLDGAAVWTCGYAAPPGGTVLAVENPFEYTTVDEIYLPEMCR
jgi:uncharacterized RDD family membrane protein YckC